MYWEFRGVDGFVILISTVIAVVIPNIIVLIIIIMVRTFVMILSILLIFDCRGEGRERGEIVELGLGVCSVLEQGGF